MAAGKSYTVNINVDPEDRDMGSPPPTAPVSLSRQTSKTKEDLWLPVVYRSVSAEVQNQIDRMTIWDLQEAWQEEQRRRSTSISGEAPVVKPEEQEHYELINQLSIQRKQSHDLRRQLSAAMSAEAEQQARMVTPPSPVPSMMTRKESQIDRVRATLRKPEGPIIDVIKEASNDDHLVPLDVLEKRYDTNMNRGLTESEVHRRRVRDGRNVLSPPNRTPAWLAFLKCLVGGFGIVLWIALVLCVLAYRPLGDPPDIYNIILALVIMLVIFAQALFFFIQERRSSNLMASFANLLPAHCEVIRDGEVKNAEASELVVGDIVRIKAGDKVPADMRVFEVNQAKVEKSSLTGESEPIPLSVTTADPNMYETKNLALFGTSILEGTAAGIVINTADRTIMGKIARVASSTSTVTTSLQKEVNYFTGLVAVMAVMVCVIVVAGYYIGVEPYHPGYLSISAVVISCIAVVVSLLPEGTPVALAMILTMIAKRMYAAKILVKKLTVLETLGSATLIASDKTGTLTQNRMTLNHMYIINDYKGGPMLADESRKKSTIQKEKYLDEAEKATTGCFGARNIGRYLTEPTLNYLCQIMCLCNKTVFESPDETDTDDTPSFTRATPTRNTGAKKCLGNPTEAALLTAAEEYLDTKFLRQATPIVKEIAFSSRTKYHLTIHKMEDRQMFQNTAYAVPSMDGDIAYNYMVFVKGAPEYVLGMCTRAVMNGDEVNMDPSMVSRIMKANELLASQGERVLAFAYRKLNNKDYPENYEFDMEDEERWANGLSFLGLAGIIDPPRQGVAESINECHAAHIRVMMVTGDQPTTAVAIARAVNIITQKNVKTMADVQKAIPFSNDDEKNETNKNKLISKLKKLVKPPHKRRFIEESIVVAGNEIGQLSGKQWDHVLLHREVVFARTTPQQKLQIVKESRKRGDIVAVTGDGVNDAPALKAADLGVAMGMCGSDVSKEAANMILLDDNFVTIVNGVKEGRLLFDNLKKVICYLFPNGSFSEILPVLANIFLGIPLPLSTFLMIVICIGSDMIGSLGLIHEHAEADIMHRPPRDAHKDRLVNPRTILFAYFFVGLMESSVAFFMYFLTMWICGHVPPSKLLFAFDKWGKEGWVSHLTPNEQMELVFKGQTAFFVSLVMTQLWNLLAVRTRYQSIFKQKFQTKLLYFMMGEVAVVLCTVYLPVIQDFMHTRPMQYYHFLIPLAMGSMILIGDEIRKFFVRKYPKGILAKLAW